MTGTMPVTVDQYSKVHIAIGDIEYVQSFNALMKNESMKSAASTLAHALDKFVASQTLLFHSWVAGQVASAGGSTNAYDPTKGIASSAEAMGAHTRLMANGCPNSDICGVSYLPRRRNDPRGSLLSSFTPNSQPDLRCRRSRSSAYPAKSIWKYASQMLPHDVTTGSPRTQGDGTSHGLHDPRRQPERQLSRREGLRRHRRHDPEPHDRHDDWPDREKG